MLSRSQEQAGAPNVRKQRKIYPVDPLIARLPAQRFSGAREPDLSQVAENALAMTLFRATEGQAVDRFDGPQHLFFHRTPNGREIDFVTSPAQHAIESKYVDAVTARDRQPIAQTYERGIIATRSAIDLDGPVPAFPASIFCWLLG